MGGQVTQMSGKLRALDFTLKKTDAVLTKEEEEISSRQKTSITKIIMAICDLKQEIEESKFSEGETEEAVSAWGEEIVQRMFEADVKVKQLNQHIQRSRAEKRLEESARELHLKRQLVEENYERQLMIEQQGKQEQLQFERKLLDQKLEYQKLITEAQPADSARKNSSAKLPKLEITRFNGSCHDWLRFGGQFSAEI